jgi:hypothetical protein
MVINEEQFEPIFGVGDEKSRETATNCKILNAQGFSHITGAS